MEFSENKNLVIDLVEGGHHFHHLRCSISGKNQLWVLTSKINSDKLALLGRDRLNITVFNVTRNYIINNCYLWLKIIGIIRSNKLDNAIHLCLDKITAFAFLRVLCPFPFSESESKIGGIFFVSNFYYKRNNNIFLFIRYLLVRGLFTLWIIRANKAKFFFFDKNLYSIFSKTCSRENVLLLNDPILFDEDFSLSECQNVNIENDYLLFIGAHNKRKGTEWALKILEESGYNGSIIVAGKILDEDLTTFLNKTCLKIQVYNHFISDNLLQTLIKESKLVVMPYMFWGGSSGIFLWAMSFNKPTLISDYGMMGDFAKRINWGYIFEHINKTSFSDMILLAVSTNYIPPFDGHDYIKKHHSPEQFAAYLHNSF